MLLKGTIKENGRTWRLSELDGVRQWDEKSHGRRDEKIMFISFSLFSPEVLPSDEIIWLSTTHQVGRINISTSIEK